MICNDQHDQCFLFSNGLVRSICDWPDAINGLVVHCPDDQLTNNTVSNRVIDEVMQ